MALLGLLSETELELLAKSMSALLSDLSRKTQTTFLGYSQCGTL